MVVLEELRPQRTATGLVKYKSKAKGTVREDRQGTALERGAYGQQAFPSSTFRFLKVDQALGSVPEIFGMFQSESSCDRKIMKMAGKGAI